MARFLLGALAGLILASAVSALLAYLFPFNPAPASAAVPDAQTSLATDVQADSALTKDAPQESSTVEATVQPAETAVTSPVEPQSEPASSVPTLQAEAETSTSSPAPSEALAQQVSELQETEPQDATATTASGLAPRPAPTLSPEQAQEARASLNTLLDTTVSPAQPSAKPQENGESQATLAPLSQEQDVPFTPAQVAQAAIANAVGAVQGVQSTQAGLSDVTPAYFTLWDTLMERCYAVVGLQKPMDEAGLLSQGEDRVRYTEPDGRQKWITRDKAFSVRVSTRSSRDARSGILRTCVLETNNAARVGQAAVSQLKERFHDWWTAARYAQGTQNLEYPYTPSDKHQWYGGLTRFGSSQGCPIKVEFSLLTISQDTEAKLFLTESDQDGCALSAGVGAGGVRVNRLPQSGN